MKSTATVAALLLAGFVSTAVAKPDCTVDALNALHVAGVQVTQASATAATDAVPAHCAVQGSMETNGDGAPPGSARFALQLPDAWQQRFFLMGVGGNAGTLTPSVNAVDRVSALGKGYAVIVQDSGHVGNGTDAGWLRTPDGKRDRAKMVDFLYRAAHDVTVTGKKFAQAYYAAPVRHAYFDGCSTGGRMAMMEAERYPADFDGIIAGDPAMDYHSTLLRFSVQKAALSSAAAYLSPDTLRMVDKIVTARCDPIDGATDGLVQDPAACPVKASDLICRAGASTDCLTAEQALVLQAYTSPLHDRHGHFLYPGWAITNLSGPRGASYWNTGDTAPKLAQAEAPWGSDPNDAPRGWTFARQALSFWMGMGPEQSMLGLDVDPRTNTVGDTLVAVVDKTFGPAETKNPVKLMPFIQQGRKLIMYHGTSDPAIPAARSVLFYNDLATGLHGMAKTQASVRLFLVPGMQHCSGGIGPDHFDTLSAIEAWVEQGKAPEAIPASTRSDSASPHSLPLCPYPRQARYSGSGALTDAANWACAVPQQQAQSK
ncbi:MAG: Tannase and feruloyl esterase [Rhodopila sp.]|nr:Tannase and feruloyl esterase [Rhodopila sp.]